MLVLAVHSFIHQGHINQNLETKSLCLCVCFFEKRAHTDLSVCYLDCVFVLAFFCWKSKVMRICVFAFGLFFLERELTDVCVCSLVCVFDFFGKESSRICVFVL